MKKMLLAFVAVLATSFAFSQTTITGTVMDGDLNEPLPGANVMVEGTTTGVSTDFDGNFTIETSQTSGNLVVSYIGFVSKTVTFSGNGSIGTVTLQADSQQLEEVVLVGVADIAKERETPVAVSTIKAAEIVEKLGSQELPEILKTTPSVYATKQGGGFGDARINIRGFNTNNIAVMINGVPVNDMENGWVYWSNWAGLSDVTSAMQVQRGLGASKLAISSVGGTINVLTQSATMAEGGVVATSLGNDDYLKTLVAYNTGLMDNGLSASVLLSRTAGDGYIDGTEFEGYNYYIALGYKPNEKHNFQFTYTGAPQWHNQHSYAAEIRNYIKYGENGEPNRKYNEQWGYLDGKVFTWRRNFYHKPVMSLNWDFNISDNMDLSTVLYASWGRGGGTGPIGNINGGREFFGQFRDQNTGLVRFDDIASWNAGGSVPDFGDDREPNDDGLYVNDRRNGFSRRASMNSHNWYGVISNLSTKLSETLTLDTGVDLRTYKGFHYRVVNDVLGADAYFDNRDDNNPNRTIWPDQFVEAKASWNPWQNIKDQEKIEYYNDGQVRWAGVFGQLEYSKDALSAFVQFSGSHQGFKRVEYFNEPPATQETDWENILGGNIKAGANYNIDEKHNIFANAGYYSKQPLFDAVYINFGNNLNPNLENEKVIGTEIGYGFRSQKFSANVNLYRTSWKDRFESTSADLDINNTPDNDEDDIRGTANLFGIEQVHMGAELDFIFRPMDRLRFNGMFSYGDWQYKGNVTANYLDDNNDPIVGPGGPFTETLYLDGVKVGDAAQMTASLGASFEAVERVWLDASVYHAANLYADVNPTDFNDADHLGSLELPSYTLIDAGASYKMLLGKNKDKSLNMRLNINNLFDELYISEAETNRHAGAGDETWEGINTRNRVYWGFGRTWNVSLRYKF